MQVTTEQVAPCKMALTISVEPEKVEAAREKAFNQFARNLQIPGFRRGKVPTQVARSYVDRSRVKQRAAEMLVEPAYEEALAETKIEPYAAPDLELVEMNDDGPFVFKALVPLKPVVMLGPYKGLAVVRHRLEVNDADVERQMEELRGRHAEYRKVEGRTAQIGDTAYADLDAVIEGRQEDESKASGPTAIEIGKNIPDFDNGLVGMAVGETKTIEAVYPADFAEEAMRGKRATFTVTIKDLLARDLPELSDEFAEQQKAYADVKTMDALRREIRNALERAAQELTDNDLDARLVDQIVHSSQVSYPDLLLRARVEEQARELQQRLERANVTLQQYLDEVGKTSEQIEQEMAASADRLIRNSLVLSEIARIENITLSEADVDAELAARAERARVTAEALRAYVEKNDQMDPIRDRARTEKVLGYLKTVSQITEKVVTNAEIPESGTPPSQNAEEVGETVEPLAVEQAAPRRRGKKAAVTETGE